VCKAVKIPVIGTGGVTDARDAVEMILVGATAVGIGSAVRFAYRGMDVFGEVASGIAEYMRRHSYARLEDFRGKALAFC
jgi:dihydroorotate dehydrogenase (NAD+) catalytic subunit